MSQSITKKFPRNSVEKSNAAQGVRIYHCMQYVQYHMNSITLRPFQIFLTKLTTKGAIAKNILARMLRFVLVCAVAADESSSTSTHPLVHMSSLFSREITLAASVESTIEEESIEERGKG
eukprot:scaffold8164_cov153-Skeletonema_dohrnii-CCMP3373.AAC.4